MLGDPDVVRKARTRQIDLREVRLTTVGADDAVAQEVLVGAVVEPDQFAGGLVDLRVGHHVAREGAEEVLCAEGFQRQRIHAVGRSAQVPGRQDLAAVVDHVGVGGILDPEAVSVAPRIALRVLHESGPQGAARLGLVVEGLGPDVPIAVPHLPVLEVRGVNHAVAVEHVIAARRLELPVRAVAQVHAVEVLGDLTDDREVVQGEFVVDGREHSEGVRIVVGGLDRASDGDGLAVRAGLGGSHACSVSVLQSSLRECECCCGAVG